MKSPNRTAQTVFKELDRGGKRIQDWFERTCLFLLLVIVGIRPLISETYDSGGTGFRLSGLADAAPLTTLLIDIVILLAACGWLMVRSMGPASSYRRCGIEVGAGVLAVAGAISCAFASNKRLAINATVDALMLPLLAVVLANLLRQRWQIRLTLCVILATASVQAWKCFEQVSGEFQDAEEEYRRQREEIWSSQGIELDSPTVELFERRMAAREATGFLAHSNVAGGYLALCALTALGLGVSRLRAPPAPFRKGFAVVLLTLAAALFGAVWTTRGDGAITASCVGIFLLFLALWKHEWLIRHRRRVWIGGWCAVALGVLAVAGHGWYWGSLPHPSLDFRWKYWTATARMIADHPWTGVGAGNFGDAYLQYKSIQSPEEVKNAHNFLVQAAADYGLLGLLGMVLMLLSGSHAAVRSSLVVAERSPHRADGLPVVGGSGVEPVINRLTGRPFAWGMALATAIFLIRIPLLGSSDINFIIVSTVIPGLIWLLTFAWVAVESDIWLEFRDDALPFLGLGVTVALFAFLLQDTINFALLVPGAATTIFALLAVVAALQKDPAQTHPKGNGPYRIALLVCGIVVIGSILGFVRPVANVFAHQRILPSYDKIIPDWPLEQQGPYVLYKMSTEEDPLDPDAPRKLGAWLQSLARHWPDPSSCFQEAVRWTREAIRRNPRSIALYRQLSGIYQEWARLENSADSLREAAMAERKVVELYPQSPDAHVALADRVAELAKAAQEGPLYKEAAAHYRTALLLDDARPEWEEIRDFTEQRRKEIGDKLDAILSRDPDSVDTP